MVEKFTRDRATITSINLVETSPTMRLVQEKRLSQPGRTLLWHNVIQDVKHSPDEYTMLLAHEFFDAMPVHLLKVRQRSPYTEIIGGG
jgi:NADH dehydrogenase [ubiquinone] 1 alpha subcomplex assembly factor 7